ncbi:MAG: S8 family serine peptidase [candidate division Zixibacteria bacterium]|nr:S8 family serine peptidase [candidate division Zixibacteria bacterium]
MIIDKSQVFKIGLYSTLSSSFIPFLLVLIWMLFALEAKADSQKHWVYFKSKGTGQIAEISERAVERRQKRGVSAVYTDLDVYPNKAYINQLESLGLKVHHVSRWLNAVSVSGGSSAIIQAGELPFVKSIKRVAAYSKVRLEYIEDSHAKPSTPPLLSDEFTDIDYGGSYVQIHLCLIDSLHAIGYTGKGVLIGMMDTGYKLDHPVFQPIINSGRLIATRDFINGGSNVGGEGAQERHGTSTFSVIGGFAESSLIGSAFGAEYMLAKTEILDNEIEAEEDNWIAAAEWMEPLGIDVISSSVGYYDWYDTTILTGDSAAITIAADIAASLGVAVVNSAGNERGNEWGTIIPPADGDSVIAVGGVNSNGDLYSRSSPGRSSWDNIKPDVSAMASSVTAANYLSDGFNLTNGTSMSAPVVAGGVALILEAHPDWNLDKLYNALRMTASQANDPDTDLGYGIPNMFDMFAIDGFFTVEYPNTAVYKGDTVEIAIALFDSLSSAGGEHDIIIESSTAEIIGNPIGTDTLIQKIYFPLPGVHEIVIYDNVSRQSKVIEFNAYSSVKINFTAVPNPASDSVIFLFELSQPVSVDIMIFNVAGEKVKTITIDENSTYEGLNRKTWHAVNDSGKKTASGIYLGYLYTEFGSEIIKFAIVK